jgi:hypothetical protein
VAAFKVTIFEKCSYGRGIISKDYNIHALDLLELEKKANPPGVHSPSRRIGLFH